MGIKAKPEEKFALIRETTMRSNNMLNIAKLCEIAGVSRSGYYTWCSNENKRQTREIHINHNLSNKFSFYNFLRRY